ncbi:MAG TPA: DUF3500 domain-containing protein [Vicinamibacterales bacterium]|nr:DUF3500 domain-containing protein [Vicinamibacterales bacterium]
MAIRRGTAFSLLAVGGLAVIVTTSALEGTSQRGRQMNPADDPFVGVTTSGTPVQGLFPIRATGVSTAPVREAAERFLGALTPAQRARTTFALDDDEWRLWNNVHRYTRQGVSFQEMTAEQRERGFDLMRAGLSARGFRQSRDIMRLNGYLAELLNRFDEYGELLYHLTVMGEPSASSPWGWQLDGHHLIVNYFVLGDQVVMTPTFMGSEPVTVASGPYADAMVLQAEERAGLAFMQALGPAERAAATIGAAKTGNNALAQAFRDNLVLDYAGLRASRLTPAAREQLMAIIGLFVGHMADGHARVKMDEVRAHLDDTWFAWIGGVGPDDVFYYRIQSPVILIEFDHQMPVALGGPRVPGKAHIHSVVRTPNGNDYGKDLLRQHYRGRAGDPSHGHAPAGPGPSR